MREITRNSIILSFEVLKPVKEADTVNDNEERTGEGDARRTVGTR